MISQLGLFLRRYKGSGVLQGNPAENHTKCCLLSHHRKINERENTPKNYIARIQKLFEIGGNNTIYSIDSN
jgi:hypothetical protein